MSKTQPADPLVLSALVEAKLKNSSHIVLARVLDILIVKLQESENRALYGVNEDWHRRHTISGPHSHGCGCIYCQVLGRYVTTKMAAHRLRRRLDDSYDMCTPFDNPLGYKMLKDLENEWPRLKAEKNNLKKLLGL